MNDRILKSSVLSVLLCSAALMSVSGVPAGRSDAEQVRSLDWQRLLAQEKKRRAELDSEIKRTKKEVEELVAQNRQLSAEVQSAREQMARLQEEADAIKESALLRKR